VNPSDAAGVYSCVRAVNAEVQVLTALHQQHAAALRAFVVGLVNGDRARAEDVVQETFLRAWRTPRLVTDVDGSARAWLFTVARRIVIDEWRSASRRPEAIMGDVPERAVSDHAAGTVERAAMLEALRLLTPEHRDVLVRCYYQGASTIEAAQQLGIPAGTVKSRLHYALHALRAALEQTGGV
jgi:RNA polymerase sigma-70 factor (ECF subfamily)